MRVLILVDIQNDFLPGGALAVPRGDEVIEPANRIQSSFDRVVATQDWHPRAHGSFASQHPGRKPGEVVELYGLQQVLWPEHCVQETQGAALAGGLTTTAIARVFRKGMDPRVDSYSGFFDNGGKNDSGLAAWLREQGAREVVVCGLALDYCVKFTALDAARLGFRTRLLGDACRAVELSPGDGRRAIEEMQSAGVELVGVSELL
ncbi:MAG: bifunctional nicotinamidase/pyrazinamidase [Deltaproteobacteria bacterium]|nr:bifunctional nicotinamidase/pyrazinamidase [Deltaproteobacteria bacterium]